MILYCLHSEIDKNKWDACIARSFNGMIYACSWYLDIVCPEWNALVSGDYEAVMPLTANKKYGISYLYQPHFTQQLGIFSKAKLTEDIVSEFLTTAAAIYPFIEINLNVFNHAKNTKQWQVKENVNYELDLIDQYEHLYTKFSENTRRNIVKSKKNMLYIQKDVAPADVIALFRSNRGKRVETLQASQYDTLLKLMNECISRKQGWCYGVKESGNRLCAGAFFIQGNGRVIFLFSGTNEMAKNNGAMFFLIDRFIEENAQRNLVLDFEGSNDPNLGRFYHGFGAKKCIYLQVKMNKLPWPLKLVKK